MRQGLEQDRKKNSSSFASVDSFMSLSMLKMNSVRLEQRSVSTSHAPCVRSHEYCRAAARVHVPSTRISASPSHHMMSTTLPRPQAHDDEEDDDFMSAALPPSNPALRYRRIMLKVSGEALQGTQGFGLDPEVLHAVARQVKAAQQADIQIAIVVGGAYPILYDCLAS
jgi:hypothetical protein